MNISNDLFLIKKRITKRLIFRLWLPTNVMIQNAEWRSSRVIRWKTNYRISGRFVAPIHVLSTCWKAPFFSSTFPPSSSSFFNLSYFRLSSFLFRSSWPTRVARETSREPSLVLAAEGLTTRACSNKKRCLVRVTAIRATPSRSVKIRACHWNSSKACRCVSCLERGRLSSESARKLPLCLKQIRCNLVNSFLEESDSLPSASPSSSLETFLFVAEFW